MRWMKLRQESDGRGRGKRVDRTKWKTYDWTGGTGCVELIDEGIDSGW